MSNLKLLAIAIFISYSALTSNKLSAAMLEMSKHTAEQRTSQEALKDQKRLLIATKAGLLEKVQELIEKNVPLDFQDSEGFTPLMQAAINGHEKIIKILISNGGDKNISNKHNKTAIQYALMNEKVLSNKYNQKVVERLFGKVANSGDREIVQMLLHTKVNQNLTKNNHNTALLLAAENGNKEIVQILLNKNMDINLQNTYGATALMLAALNGHTETVNTLLSAGANVNTTDEIGITALIMAILKRNTEIVRILINKKANQKNNRNGLILTAEYFALGSNHFYIAKEIGSKFSTEELLIKAIKALKIDDIKLFIGDNPSLADFSCDKFGTTPLMTACETGNKEAVELLLSKGANIFAKTKSGWTALKIANENNFTEIVTLLQQKIDSLDQAANKAQAALLSEEESQQATSTEGAEGASLAAAVSRSWSEDKSPIENASYLDEEFIEHFLKLEKARQNKSKSPKKTKSTNSPKKSTNITRCDMHERVQIWFKFPEDVLTEEYSAVRPTLYDEIIFHHDFAQAIDNIAKDFCIYEYDKLNHETSRALCYVIKDGRKMVPQVIEYGIDNTKTREDNKPTLVHRFMNKIEKHPEIRKLFRPLPADTKQSDFLKIKPLSDPAEDGSYIVREEADFIEIYDPKNNATIFICRPK